MWAAPELLGAPTMGGVMPGPGGGGGGGHRSQISFPSCPKYTKTAKKNGQFCSGFDLHINRQKRRFSLKSTYSNKIYLQDVFEE